MLKNVLDEKIILLHLPTLMPDGVLVGQQKPPFSKEAFFVFGFP
jgi:hypothetical protein